MILSDSHLVVYSRPAMACKFEFYFPVDRKAAVAEAALHALDLVEMIEAKLTVYRDTSEISRLNRSAAKRSQVVDGELFALLKLAVEISEQTEGAFDITNGPLCRLWQAARSARRLPEEEEIQAALERSRPSRLQLDEATQSVRLTAAGAEIQLNSIGKGYALDQAASSLRSRGIDVFLLHGGNSSIYAGDVAPGGDAWCIGIRHPRRPEQRVAELHLSGSGVGTSGSGTQYFHHRGRRYGHILDPRTGRPASGVHSATAVAETAAAADAFATAFYVMGPDATRRYCDTHPQVAAVLVCPGETADTIAVHTCNLDATRCQVYTTPAGRNEALFDPTERNEIA
jgi:thiamine biosynthesis lipoprotein